MGKGSDWYSYGEAPCQGSPMEAGVLHCLICVFSLRGQDGLLPLHGLASVNVWKSYSWSYGVFLDLLFVIYRCSVSLSREDVTCLRDVVPATASGSKTSLKKQAEGEEKLGMVSALCPGKAYTHLAGAALLGKRSASAQRRANCKDPLPTRRRSTWEIQG